MKQKFFLIVFTVIIGALLLTWKFFITPNPPTTKEVQKTAQSTDGKPQVVSTKPDPLNDSIVPASQIIEITFNRPLENVGEFKVKIEPKTDFKVELSSDRKTAKITPVKPFELGTTYNMSIGTETKFDGVGRWGEEKVFQFRTIRYRGV